MSGHVTIVSTVYHRASPHDESTSVLCNFGRDLASDEQPCGPRTVKVGEEWQPLELGWLKDCVGMVIITNEEGRFPQRKPSEEEKAEAAERMLQVAVVMMVDWATEHLTVPFALVLPTETLCFCPADASALRVRCRKGTAKVTITLLPK